MFSPHTVSECPVWSGSNPVRAWELLRHWSPLLSLLFLIDLVRFELDLSLLVDIVMEVIMFCTFITTVALVMYSYARTKRRFSEDLARDGDDGISPENAQVFLSRLKRSMLGSSSAAILVVVVLFTLVFVYNIIGEYAFLVFGAFIALIVGGYYYQIHKLNGLEELDRGRFDFVYAYTERICQRYDLRMPRLVVFDNPNVNAFTTSFMGRRSVIAITDGMLDLHETGRLTDEQLVSITGHEFGHIMNNDATINTLLTPMISFIQGVLLVLRFIALGIYRVMVATVKVGTSSLIGFGIAVGVGLLLLLLLIIVGVYLVIFFLVVYAVGLCWNAFKRQQEYSADLFAALTQRTPVHIVTGLMELTRHEGLKGLAMTILEEDIKGRADSGQFSQMSRSEVEDHIDKMVEDFDIEAYVKDHPDSIGSMRDPDARHLLERRDMDPFNDGDLRDFADFEYTLKERMGEFVYAHPLSGKRVRGVASVAFD